MGKKPKFRITINTLTSWGASIVIIGVMAKLLRWHAADTLIIVGMLTEAILFFIMGFQSDEIRVVNESGEEIPVQSTAANSISAAPAALTTPVQPTTVAPILPVFDQTGYTQEMEAMVANLQRLNNSYLAMQEELDQMGQVAGHTTRVREETEKLAKNLTALNAVYRNMLSAMNMPNA